MIVILGDFDRFRFASCIKKDRKHKPEKGGGEITEHAKYYLSQHPPQDTCMYAPLTSSVSDRVRRHIPSTDALQTIFFIFHFPRFSSYCYHHKNRFPLQLHHTNAFIRTMPPLLMPSAELSLSVLTLLSSIRQNGNNESSPGSNKNITILIIVLSCVTAVGILVPVVCFLRLWATRRRREALATTDMDTTTQTSRSPLEPQNPSMVRLQRLAHTPGLTTEELDEIAPIVPHTKSPKSGTGEEQDSVCPICLEEMEIDSKTRRLPCSHVFDARCIEEWAAKANRCPVCNVEIWNMEKLYKIRITAIQGRVMPADGSRRRRRVRSTNGRIALREGVERTSQDHSSSETEGADANEETNNTVVVQSVRPVGNNQTTLNAN